LRRLPSNACKRPSSTQCFSGDSENQCAAIRVRESTEGLQRFGDHLPGDALEFERRPLRRGKNRIDLVLGERRLHAVVHESGVFALVVYARDVR
jgi:hypothetical protein